jgi:hypothetical protein
LNTYEDFQNKNVSEKITLARVKATKRLIGFVVHSGSIYKIENFDFAKINFVKDSGTQLVSQSSLASVVSGSYFNDRENKTLYLQTSDSSNPNGKFLAMQFDNFFSNVGVVAPNDLSTGFDVYWEPLIKLTSEFGVALDNEDQLGFALEGSGSISFILSREYFDERFEGFVWENGKAEIYSWNRNLPATEAKIIYRGTVNSRRFGRTVDFRLKDQIKQLRREFPAGVLSDISGALLSDSLLNAKKRIVYGRPNGVRPANIDQALEGYELAGTIAVTIGSDVITGTGTSFRSWFSPGDTIKYLDVEYSVKSITSDTSLTITEASEIAGSGLTFYIEPDFPKNFINRKWSVAGHECSQVETTVLNADSQNVIYLSEFNDIEIGDELYFGAMGSRERAFVNKIFSNGKVELAQNLESPPVNGTEVIRPCVQNLRINNRRLLFDRDFDVEILPTETNIVLNSDAEKNINPVRSVNGTVQFNNASTAVTGSGTNFLTQLQVGQHIRSVGQVAFFQIMSIESDTALTLVSAASYTQNSAAQYKGGTNFDPESDVLSCTVIGATVDGDKAGDLLIFPGEIVKDILTRSGAEDLNSASFALADDSAQHRLGFVIPETFSATTAPNVRDVINNINVSVFGSLVQNEDFELEYNILKPNRPSDAVKLTESDIFEFAVESQNDRLVKDVVIEYDQNEYSPTVQDKFSMFFTKVSDTSQYLTGVEETRHIKTVLIDEKSARMFANRYSFLLEIATNVISFKTKLQGARLQVNDVIYLEHEKFYDRVGGGKARFAAVQSIKKTGSMVLVEADDLSNAFNRVCIIVDDDEPIFAESSIEQRAKNGFITDEFGLIDNANFGYNLIW